MTRVGGGAMGELQEEGDTCILMASFFLYYTAETNLTFIKAIVSNYKKNF